MTKEQIVHAMSRWCIRGSGSSSLQSDEKTQNRVYAAHSGSTGLRTHVEQQRNSRFNMLIKLAKGAFVYDAAL